MPPPPNPDPRRADWAPFDLVLFDCDSTLVSVEGIDELARWQGRAAEVAALTQRAMDGEVPLEAVYSRRLELLQPTRDELRRLARLYRESLVPGADRVVRALLDLGRQVFIVSGGLAEAVAEFGAGLGLPPGSIFAVGTDYDALSGRWWETWQHPRGQNPAERYLAHDDGPLTYGTGKTEVVRRLRAGRPGRALLVGDGTSDLAARPALDLFVGFGGVVHRQRVAAEADVYIHTASLAPVLPLALARPAVAGPHAALYAEGVARLHAGEVTFRDPAAREGLLRRLGAQR